MKIEKIVFADFHHTDLFHSLWLLFEKRLGWKLYTCIGDEWYKNGYWKYSDSMDTMKQYLSPKEVIQDKYRDKNCSHFFPGSFSDHYFTEDVYYRGITFQEFLDLDVDIIIPSVYNNEIPFYNLQQKYKPDAKLIRHTGNPAEPTNVNIYKNQLCSSLMTYRTLPDTINRILYHQEFDTNLFNHKIGSSENNKIRSFINNMRLDNMLYKLWYEYKTRLPEFQFMMHGTFGENNVLYYRADIPIAMHDSMFIWHVKPTGDGFGYSLHYAYACGRPVITRIQDYKDHLGGLLMEDGVTCIDIGNCSIEDGIAKIRYHSKHENYEKISRNAYERFKQVVDYDKEFIEIKKFLERLV